MSKVSLARPRTGPITVFLVNQSGDDNLDLTFDTAAIRIAGRSDSVAELQQRSADLDCIIGYPREDDPIEVVTDIKSAVPTVPCLLIIDRDSVESITAAYDAGATDVTVRDPEIDWRQVLKNRIATVVDHDRSNRSSRYQAIMEAIEDGIYLLDDEFKITWVNDAAASMLDYTRDDLIGAHSTMLTDEGTIEEAARISLELQRGEREMGLLETHVETAEGNRIPIETQFTLLPLDDGGFGQVGVFRDISERKAYERTLTDLYHSTRQLLQAESTTEVCQIVSRTAVDVLDLPFCGVYLLGSDPTALEPIAAEGDEFEDPLVEMGAIPASQDSILWGVFVDEDPAAIDDIEATTGAERGRETAPIGGLVVPLGDFGVLLAAGRGDDPLDLKSRRLLDLLGTTTIAALEGIEKGITIQDRDRELTQQARHLTRLNHINDTIRRVQKSLVEANTRMEIEEAVVTQLVEDDRFDFAWIGAKQPNLSGIVPRAWAGTDRGYLDLGDGDITVGEQEPSRRAVANKTAVVIDDIGQDLHRQTWRKSALSKGYRSVIAVPLLYNEFLYGVLSIYSNRPSGIGQMSRVVFEELGETIGYAINSIQSKRTLLTDHTDEIELVIREPDELLTRIGAAVGRRLTFRNVVPQPDGTSRVFFTATGDPEGIETVEGEIMAIESLNQVAERNDSNVFEAKIDGSTIPTTLMDYGAICRSVTVEAEEARTVVELPSDADVRAFVATVKRMYPETELISRRSTEPEERSRTSVLQTLEDRVTDRQLEVLRTAYVNGYFEWPRERNGEEVAATLGIAQPTFNRHLREGERKLFEMLFSE